MVGSILSKHTTYFEVLDALAEDGCPICRLGLRAVSRYFDVLSYEGVNDPGLRAQLRAARGFCNWHAWQFAEEVHDGLGAAIIYRDILGTLLGILDSLWGRAPVGESGSGRSLFEVPTGQKRGAAAGDRLAARRRCPACHSLADSSQRYLDTLLAHLAESEFYEQYSASDGLCAPHLAMGLRRVRTSRDLELLIAAFAQRRISPWTGLSAPALSPAVLIETMVGKEGAIPRAPAVANDSSADQSLEISLAIPLLGTAVDGDSCPVCRSAISAVDEWLGAVSAPQDLAFLCNAHAWRFLSIGKKTVVTLWQPWARAIADTLQSLPPAQEQTPATWRRLFALFKEPAARRVGATAAARLTPEGQCLACQIQRAGERLATAAILERSRQRQPDLRNPFGLCLPHFALALESAANRQEERALLSSQIEILRKLRAELSEYIRKQDYRFRHEPLAGEADSPWRAIAQVAGAKGLCGYGLGKYAASL